jgi:hypothetical protein
MMLRGELGLRLKVKFVMRLTADPELQLMEAWVLPLPITAQLAVSAGEMDVANRPVRLSPYSVKMTQIP